VSEKRIIKALELLKERCQKYGKQDLAIKIEKIIERVRRKVSL